MKKITTCLWFDNQAEEAAMFYTSIFPGSKTGRVTCYTKEGYEFHARPEGSVMTVEFEIGGSSFIALNGGPVFRFNEAVSFTVNCDSQDEVDYYWDRLSAGGDPGAQQCGWLKDKYGVSWQIVPVEFTDMVNDRDIRKVEKVLNLMFTMKKLDIEKLRKAFNE